MTSNKLRYFLIKIKSNMKTILIIFLFCTGISLADVEYFERKETDTLTIVSMDESTTLTVSIERIDRDQIREVNKGENKKSEAWFGDQQLPSAILSQRAIIIKSFKLTIDGKNIPVPPRFWNDIAGLNLEQVIVKKKPEHDDNGWLLHEFTQQSERPQISRSANRGTVLISWSRPED